MKDWIKEKLGITALERENSRLERENSRLKQQMENHSRFVSAKVAELKEYTRVDADMGVRSNNTIVLTGIYRNKAFVRFYDVGDGEFRQLVDQVRDMTDHAVIRHIDSPPQLRGAFEF